jgi:hypothetical protein
MFAASVIWHWPFMGNLERIEHVYDNIEVWMEDAGVSLNDGIYAGVPAGRLYSDN